MVKAGRVRKEELRTAGNKRGAEEGWPASEITIAERDVGEASGSRKSGLE
jgi:hypothetical protein